MSTENTIPETAHQGNPPSGSAELIIIGLFAALVMVLAFPVFDATTTVDGGLVQNAPNQ